MGRFTGKAVGRDLSAQVAAEPLPVLTSETRGKGPGWAQTTVSGRRRGRLQELRCDS